MSICIFGPYGHDELTPVVLAIADVADNRHRVQYYCAGSRKLYVDSRWDTRILPVTTRQMLRTQCCVWVGYCPQMFRQVFRAGLGIRHILLLNWHDLTPRTLEDCAEFDLVVCPSTLMRYALRQHVDPDKLASISLGFVPLGQVKRVDRLLCPRVCIYLNRYTQRMHGDQLLLWVDLLLGTLDCLNKFQVTLLVFGSWTRQQRKLVGMLRRVWGNKFQLAYGPDKNRRRFELSRSGWFIDLSVRGSSGYYACEAIDAQVPVFGWNRPPLDEVISKTFGRLAAAKLDCTEFNAPTVILDDDAKTSLLTTVVTGVTGGRPFRPDWEEWSQQLEIRRTIFTNYWRGIFGGSQPD